MSGWIHFRKTWLKPEVYPLVGAMSAAVGICGYAIYNKTRDSTVSWNKTRRITDADVTHKQEVVPVLTSMRGKSTRIFDSDRTIFENQYGKIDTEPLKFTIRVGESDDEEEQEEQEEAAEEKVDLLDAAEKIIGEATKGGSAEDVDLLSMKDQNPEAMQAAVDAALDVALPDPPQSLSNTAAPS